EVRRDPIHQGEQRDQPGQRGAGPAALLALPGAWAKEGEEEGPDHERPAQTEQRVGLQTPGRPRNDDRVLTDPMKEDTDDAHDDEAGDTPAPYPARYPVEGVLHALPGEEEQIECKHHRRKIKELGPPQARVEQQPERYTPLALARPQQTDRNGHLDHDREPMC